MIERRARMAIEVLIIGDAATATKRLNELRLRGVPAWLATTEAELTWLLEKAAAKPSHAVVDLPSGSEERAWVLSSRVAVATLAQLPTVLVGARADEARHFSRVIATFDAAPDTDQLLAALRDPT